jgi:hypothetical protein
MKMSPPSLASKNEPKKKPAWLSACYVLVAGFFICLFFNPEDGSDMFLRNVGCHYIVILLCGEEDYHVLSY